MLAIISSSFLGMHFIFMNILLKAYKKGRKHSKSLLTSSPKHLKHKNLILQLSHPSFILFTYSLGEDCDLGFVDQTFGKNQKGQNRPEWQHPKLLPLLDITDRFRLISSSMEWMSQNMTMDFMRKKEESSEAGCVMEPSKYPNFSFPWLAICKIQDHWKTLWPFNLKK